MPEDVKGIFNPFVTKKPQKKNPKSSIEQINEEEGIIVPSTVTLDGDSYGITFKGVDTPEDAAERLVGLIYEVSLQHKEELNRHGVSAGEPTKDDEVALHANDKHISVYIEDNVQDEVPVYRRIAHALLQLPIQKILRAHAAQIYERG
jgi:hypothetical protein